MELIWYPKCSTCQKAYKHLLEKNIDVTTRHIVEDTPSKEEIKHYITLYNQGIKPFFNISGMVYRQMNLKDKIDSLSIDEAAALLSSNGMLIKRPLLINQDKIMIGYKKLGERLKNERV